MSTKPGELHTIASHDDLNTLKGEAKQDYRNSSQSWYFRFGVWKFLVRCHREGVTNCLGLWSAQTAMHQALTGPELPPVAFSKGGIAAKALTGTSLEPAIVLGPVLVSRRLTHRDIGVAVRDMHPAAQNVLRSLHIIKRRKLGPVDQIAEVIRNRYSLSDPPLFKRLLGSQYTHCLQLIREADDLFDVSRSQWLVGQDSFNDAVIRRLLTALNAHGLPGGRPTIGQDGKLVDYGVLLDRNGVFTRRLPLLADPLRLVHQRRNRLPNAHPYDKKTGYRNRHLTLTERQKLFRELSTGYSELAKVLKRIS